MCVCVSMVTQRLHCGMRSLEVRGRVGGWGGENTIKRLLFELGTIFDYRAVYSRALHVCVCCLLGMVNYRTKKILHYAQFGGCAVPQC